MEQLLIGNKPVFGPFGVNGRRHVRTHIVLCANLVNAHDNLVHLTFISCVRVTHLCRRNLTEFRFPLYIIPCKVSLVVNIIIPGGKVYWADWENAGRHIVPGVCEERHAHICQVSVGLPALSDTCHQFTGTPYFSSCTHFLLPPYALASAGL